MRVYLCVGPPSCEQEHTHKNTTIAIYVAAVYFVSVLQQCVLCAVPFRVPERRAFVRKVCQLRDLFSLYMYTILNYVCVYIYTLYYMIYCVDVMYGTQSDNSICRVAEWRSVFALNCVRHLYGRSKRRCVLFLSSRPLLGKRPINKPIILHMIHTHINTLYTHLHWWPACCDILRLRRFKCVSEKKYNYCTTYFYNLNIMKHIYFLIQKYIRD